MQKYKQKQTENISELRSSELAMLLKTSKCKDWKALQQRKVSLTCIMASRSTYLTAESEGHDCLAPQPWQATATVQGTTCPATALIQEPCPGHPGGATATAPKL